VTRIGLISDIHGNLPALEAVLAELEQEELDALVCLGDVALGPQPHETLARVRGLGCPVVMGNWDAWLLDRPPVPEFEIGVRLHEIAAFWAESLTEDDLAYVRTFVPQVELPLGDGRRAVCFHGSTGSNEDFIFATTPDDELARMLGATRAEVMIGGHAHLQLLRRFERTLFVNPGSVGQPFSEWWPREIRIAPWAEYGVLTWDEERLHVDLRRTSFDVEALLRLSRASGMPHAEWWAGCWQEVSSIAYK
jgi:predicted phosphodiesterase